MADVILYGAADRAHERAARLALEEKGVPYDLVDVPLGQWNEPAHLSRHPFGRIPVFEHRGFVLYETQAILRYVDAAFPGVPLQPTDPRQAARMNQIMGIVDSYVVPNVSYGICFQRLRAPLLGRVPDEAMIVAALPMARTCLDAIDALKGDNPFLAGGEISLADLMLAPHYFYFSITPEGRDVLGPHQRLRHWWQTMETRDSVRQTAPKLG
jgi:glutathione S-transferase